jgi:hypothetical protein
MNGDRAARQGETAGWPMAIAGVFRLSAAGLSTPSPETIACLRRLPAGPVAGCRGEVPEDPASEVTTSGTMASGTRSSGTRSSGATVSGVAVSETKSLRLPRAAFKEGSA